MRLHIRPDTLNRRHVLFTVFAEGANCGTLTMTRKEYNQFIDWLHRGRSLWDQLELTAIDE